LILLEENDPASGVQARHMKNSFPSTFSDLIVQLSGLIRVDTSISMVRHCSAQSLSICCSCWKKMSFLPLFSSDAAVCDMYSLVELDIILVSLANFFELAGKNGEVRFKIDGLVAYYFLSSF
jgi:hypothetical protein